MVRTVGGRATPASCSARLVAGRRAERTSKRFAVLRDLDLGQRTQVGEDVGLGAGLAGSGGAVLQGLLQHQREETAEDMAEDRGVQLMEDRPRAEEALIRGKIASISHS